MKIFKKKLNEEIYWPRPAQTAQTVKFMFSNVAYRTTVYKTGI